jgi:hypothetical protein
MIKSDKRLRQAIEEDDYVDAMSETFRLRKWVKYQGMAFTAIFLVALFGYSSVFFLEEPAKHGFRGEHSVAIVGGMGLSVFGSMLLMSIYLWAAYYVERFTINGTTLSIRSLLQSRQFDVSELQRQKWRVHPVGGSILFRVLGSKARLDLYGYAKDDRLKIIRALHELVPAQVQEGWPLFCHQVALPLRDGIPSIVRSEQSSKLYTITRKRYDRMLVFGFPLSVALAIAMWASLDLWQFFVLPFLAIAAWILLRFHVPREGRSEARLTSTPLGRAHLIGWGAIVSSQILLLGLALLDVAKPIACSIACILLVAAIPPMLYFNFKSAKQRRTEVEQTAELASARWQQGEGAAANTPPLTVVDGRAV